MSPHHCSRALCTQSPHSGKTRGRAWLSVMAVATWSRDGPQCTRWPQPPLRQPQNQPRQSGTHRRVVQRQSQRASSRERAEGQMLAHAWQARGVLKSSGPGTVSWAHEGDRAGGAAASPRGCWSGWDTCGRTQAGLGGRPGLQEPGTPGPRFPSQLCCVPSGWAFLQPAGSPYG